VAVRKPDGSARLCVDFKKVNALTKDQPFYMPQVEEVLEGIGQAKFVSKLDLTKGYYQVQMAPGDISKTAFICHRGRFEFTRMPFGLKNAPAYFQEIMQGIFEGNESCTPYMDDLIIFSSTWEDHLRDVERVLQTLKEAGLTANPSKCVWGGKFVEFLGHKVGGGRMALPRHRAEAFKKYSLPTTKKGLRSFIGAVSFYRRYVKQLASETAKLTPLTSKLAPLKVVWSREGELAFHNIVSLICNTSELCIPLTEDKYSLVTDASGLGIGGVLQVDRHGTRGSGHGFVSGPFCILSLWSHILHIHGPQAIDTFIRF